MKPLLFLILTLILLPVNGNSYALQNNFTIDTSEVLLRKPSENTIDNFRKDKDFSYGRAETPVGFLEILSAWIRDLLRNLFGSKAFNYAAKYLSYLIVLAAVIAVLYIIYKTKNHSIFYSTDEISPFNFKEVNENIHEIDFDNLINDALGKKEYRIALRYYYLNTLKLLTDKGWIDWKINKTNNQYVKEIKEWDLKQSFSELTNLFDWVWYGEAAIENSFFENAREKFISFNNNLAVRK